MNNGAQQAYPFEHAANNAPGLTKREYFAGLAMQGLCANSKSPRNQPKYLAELAVGQADELLKALEISNDNN